MGRPRIANFGAYDHDSYGDLLFPFITENWLGDEFDIVHVAPTNATTSWSDAKEVISVEAASSIKWDGILVGGGDIVQASEWAYTQWRAKAGHPLASLPSLWIGAGLLATRLGVPLVWNAPGVPLQIPNEFTEAARMALDAASYVSVRDVPSRQLLSALGPNQIEIVPDSAISLPRVWPQPQEPDRDTVVCSVSEADSAQRADEVAAALVELQSTLGVMTERLPLTAWQRSEAAGVDENTSSVAGAALTVRGAAESIASSAGYIGNSLHGFITAVAYRRAAVLVIPADGRTRHKYTGFVSCLGGDPDQCIAGDWESGAHLFSAKNVLDVSDEVEARVDRHWTEIRHALAQAAPSSTRKAAWARVRRTFASQALDGVNHGYLPRATAELLSRSDRRRNEAEQAEARLAAELQRASSERAELQEFLDRLRTLGEVEQRAHEAEVVELRGEMQRLRAALEAERTASAEQLHRVNADLAVARADHAALIREVGELQAKLVQLLDDREAATRDYERVVTSMSWRLGAPLRWTRRQARKLADGVRRPWTGPQ